MNERFQIFEVSLEAPEEQESLGTKEKFWFRHEQLGWCLYKKSRSKTAGEDWSEKIAAELCRLLKLPHAEYELATCNGEYGVISRSFLPKNATLLLGNEILARIYSDYPTDTINLSHHTIERIFTAFDRLETNLSEVLMPLDWKPLENISKVHHTFVGYLLLDAWIGNSDRHHENWGFIELEQQLYLAPTYDHASSLGRNESDDKRLKRLKTSDIGYSVGAYADRCDSSFYDNIGQSKLIKAFESFAKAAKLYPEAACVWLNILKTVLQNDTFQLLQRIPENRISAIAIEFAQNILNHNRDKLLKFRE